MLINALTSIKPPINSFPLLPTISSIVSAILLCRFTFSIARARTNPIWFGYIQIEVGSAAITNFSLLHPGSGNLFSIGGGETVRSRSYVGSGTLFNFVSSEEKIATDYIGSGGIKFIGDTRVSFAPNWFGEGTVKVDGTPTKLLRTFAQNEVGNLFAMSGEGYHERRTYDYNDSSIVFFDYENFGFIPSTASVQSITSSQILSGVKIRKQSTKKIRSLEF